MKSIYLVYTEEYLFFNDFRNIFCECDNMGKAYDDFKRNSEETGYYVNNDVEFVEMLLNNIQVNIDRYGYGACPCRLASGNKEEDLDLICPCDYRDSDLNDYGMCFCGLYLTKDVLKGKKEIQSIPDRRFKDNGSNNLKLNNSISDKSIFKEINLKYPVYRCKVCGYLCSRENPPNNCPICKVDSDRFEIIL